MSRSNSSAGLRPANPPATRQRGFTLIELLISITLVSAMSVGMLVALRTSLLTMQKTTTRLDDNRRALGIEQMINRQLGGAMPVRGECSMPGGLPTSIPVFNGTPFTLHLVSSYSMNEGARGYPRLIEYQVAPDQGGTVKLIANEYLYSGPASTAPICFNNLFLPVRITPQTFVVAEGLAYCRFVYREFHDVNPITRLGGKWVPEWTRADLPSGVRIEMESANPNARQMPVVPITVWLHITRQAQVSYVEQ